MPRPTVGVVVTTHNYGRFLETCLRSIDEQTEPPDVLVVVDDASEDDTQRVLDQVIPTLALADRVRVSRSAVRRGFAASLNHGFSLCDTELIAHVDADDRCLPRYVEALRAALESHPEAAYAYPRLQLTGAESGVYRSFPFHAGRLLFQGNYIPNVVMIRRTAFADTAGYRQLHTHLDWDLWLDLLARGHRGVFVDEVLYEWYRHTGAMTYQSRRVRLTARLSIAWRHRWLLLRYVHLVLPWTLRAIARRLGLTRERRGESGWLEP